MPSEIPETKGKAIVATHNLPVVCQLTSPSFEELAVNPLLPLTWEFNQRSNHSALFSGVKIIDNAVYVGFVGDIIDSAGDVLPELQLSQYIKDSLISALSHLSYIPIFLSTDLHNGFYNGYCKTSLWRIFHYVVWNEAKGQATDGKLEKEYYAKYRRVNQIFASTIASAFEEGDVVWIHDYHLFLAISYLRMEKTKATIGFFFHLPF